MRANGHQLYGLIEPAVTVLGYELVGIDYSPVGKRPLLRIYIDSEVGITVDDCERVSHQISGVLDVENPIGDQYTLEVSSPGLDRPLFTPRHFERFAGRCARVKLDTPVEGRRNFKGTLQGFQDGMVMITENGVQYALPLEIIRRARLVPEI